MNNFFKVLKYSVLGLVVLPAAVQAQASPDSQGNYYRNETDVQAATGSLWRVVSDNLNCRKDASLNSFIHRTYVSGELLEVEVYRGGSDEVLINPLDRNGRPWMPVRGVNIEDICYVRANSRYIQPFTAR
jgi:hypothetical protein